MNPDMYKEMHLPLEFISFGIIEAKMYTHHGRNKTFIVKPTTRRWGNSVCYGALFLCDDYDFYSRILDAYNICSMSTLFRNHKNDLHHRIEDFITPIHFDSLEEFVSLRYKESEPILAQIYVGNTKHPKIINRIKYRHQVSYRINSGIDGKNFKRLFWEVNKVDTN